MEDAREALLPLGPQILPHALAAYGQLRGYRGRAALIHTATKFALVAPEAVELGIAGVADRSSHVRYKACLLLAVAQARRALPALEVASAHPDPATQADARAAVRAITKGNRHLFIDRDGTGRSFLSIGGLVEPAAPPPKTTLWSRITGKRSTPET